MTVIPHSLFTEFDISLFKSGKHFKLYEKLGSHLVEVNGEQGVYFSVWAPDADSVSVMGRFNHWNADSHALNVRWDGSGIWEGFIPGLGNGELYKYGIRAKSGEILEKGDPFARFWEVPPKTASIVWDVEYDWTDGHWLKNRHDKAAAPQPISIYELHMGSWMKIHVEGNRSLSYREMATKLIPYVQKMGFTHVEFMPVMQHPYFQSWGYQITGYFASDSRFGRPEDFMYLVDKLHEAGIGVILDWVPSHFPGDAHGLYQFDGSHLYEHADPKKGYHPDWTSYIFNYGRHEVRSFLISNALFWIDCFHVEGLRVDAVASMLYLDYSRKEGEWEPNQYGGNENLEAVHFLQELNNALHQHFPDALTIAEESTSWSGVTAPTEYGGLGFDRKWMMGWMHDTLRYLQRDPIYRGHHQSELTFSLLYAFTERFVLPLSHDEVVHGKGSLLSRMPGDEWQRFANLRLLFGYMFTHPGDKLLFMGAEIGQGTEWDLDHGVEWHLTDYPMHQGVQRWVADLNQIFKENEPLWKVNYSVEGFEWVAADDTTNNVLAYLRKNGQEQLLVVCNFSPNTVMDYRVGVPTKGNWKEIANSNDEKYGGSGLINHTHKARKEFQHGKNYSIHINLCPLSVMIFSLSEK